MKNEPENIIEMSEEQKAEAFKWWNSLTFEHKFYKAIEWLQSQNRNTAELHPNDFTGREVEEIYRNFTQRST